MSINKIDLIKKLEFECSIEFPFEYENVNTYEIEETDEMVVSEKMYFYKFLSVITFDKEDLEAYLSYFLKLDEIISAESKEKF